MPPPVAHWPDVKATAIQTGSLKEASQIHQISYDAVKMRASREEWPVGQRVHKMAREAQETANRAIVQCSKGAVTSVTSAADAAEIALREGAKATKLGLTSYAKRMAEQAATSGILEEAPLYKAVADIHAKMHPEQQETHGPQLNFFAISMEQPGSAVERPVIDAEQA